jgi:hypothetical protein
MPFDDQFHHSDPLPKKLEFSGLELLKRFGREATGFPAKAICDASINLLANVLRQTYGKRSEAFARIDSLVADLKNHVDQFYDPVTDRRRSTIPFTQVVSMPHVKMDDRKH